MEIEIGGCGALPYTDGASAHAFGMHNNSNIPIEMIEGDTPITVLGYGLIQIQGGPGAAAGGLGLWREWRIDSAEAWLTTNLDRFRFPPFGLAGGLPARLSALYLIRDGNRQALPSKLTNLLLRKGDIIRLETSGGGGFGDPDPDHTPKSSATCDKVTSAQCKLKALTAGRHYSRLFRRGMAALLCAHEGRLCCIARWRTLTASLSPWSMPGCWERLPGSLQACCLQQQERE